MASAIEQAAGHGANEDILSFVNRIAPLLSPNVISTVTHRKGSGEKRAKVIENTDFVIKVTSACALASGFLPTFSSAPTYILGWGR